MAVDGKAETNAAVRILGGLQRLWHTGASWNTGTVLDQPALQANLRYAVQVTRNRTDEQAACAFIQDRQHQSYAAIAGLGPLDPRPGLHPPRSTMRCRPMRRPARRWARARPRRPSARS